MSRDLSAELFAPAPASAPAGRDLSGDLFGAATGGRDLSGDLGLSPVATPSPPALSVVRGALDRFAPEPDPSDPFMVTGEVPSAAKLSAPVAGAPFSEGQPVGPVVPVVSGAELPQEGQEQGPFLSAPPATGTAPGVGGNASEFNQNLEALGGAAKRLMSPSRAESSARAANMVALSELPGAPSPGQIESSPGTYQALSREVVGGGEPSTGEVAGAALGIGMAGGLATAPVKTLLGLGKFMAADEALKAVVAGASGQEYKPLAPLSDYLPADSSDHAKFLADVAELVLPAKIVGSSLFKKAVPEQKALMVMDAADWAQQGLSEGEMLRRLRKSGDREAYDKAFQEAMAKRGAGAQAQAESTAAAAPGANSGAVSPEPMQPPAPAEGTPTGQSGAPAPVSAKSLQVATLEKLQLERAVKDAALEEAAATGVPVGEPYGPPPPSRPERQPLRLVKPADQVQPPGGAAEPSQGAGKPGPVSESAIPPNARPAGGPSMVEGSSTRIFTAGKKEPYPGHYAVMELGDLQTSHLPDTFGKNPLYPEGVQERDYAGDKHEQMKVIDHAQNLETAYLLTNNPDAINGPSIVTPDGVALGGNSRAMSLARAYAGDKGEVYKADLEKYAPFFGLDAKAVAGMDKPVLVRVFDPGEAADAKALHRYASEFNQSPAQELGQEARTASLGNNISPETLGWIGDMMSHRFDSSLRELLDAPKWGARVLNRLIEDGAISQTEVGRYWSGKHRKLNAEGKTLVERAILGSMVPDVEVLNYAPESILNKISGAIPSLARVKSADGADFTADLEPAVRLIMEAEAKGGKNTRDWELALARQQGLEPRTQFFTPRQVQLAIALKDMGPNQFREAAKSYAGDTAATMFGPGMPPEEAFAKHFGEPPAWAGQLGETSAKAEPKAAGQGGFGFADTGGYADIPPAGKAQDAGSAVVVRGDEFAPYDDPGTVRERVIAFAKKHLFGMKVENEAKRWKIGFNLVGIKKALKGGPEKAAMIRHLPEMLRTASYMGKEAPVKDKGAGIIAYHYFKSNVMFNGESRPVVITVREVSQGKFFYDHAFWKGRGPAGTSRSTPPVSGEQLSRAANEPSEPNMEPGAPGVKGKTPSGQADTGGYASQGGHGQTGAGQAPGDISPLEGPEIVELGERILGKAPRVVKKLRIKDARGVFYPGKGSIELAANIAENPADVYKTVAHEIGHAIDWLPDKDMKRGNLLGRIASLKKYMGKFMAGKPGGPGPLTAEDERRLRADAEIMLTEPGGTVEKWLDEEITRTTGVTPEQVLSIWNDASNKLRTENPGLYNFVAGLDAAAKKQIMRQALKGLVPDELKQFTSTVTEKTGRKILVEEEIKPSVPSRAAVERKFQELFQDEVRKRALLSDKVVREELKKLTLMWKPFQPGLDKKYTNYRFSGPELYADALSVLLNRPDILKQVAPEFTRGFFAYMENKPEVKAAWDDLQARLNDPNRVMAARQARERAGFRAADLAMGEAGKREDLPLSQTAAFQFIDQHSQVLRRVRAVQDKDPGARAVEFLLEEMRYSGSQERAYLQDQHENVLTPLAAAGLTEEDLGSYLKLYRSATERGKLFNPHGETPKTAMDRLAWMRETMGEEKFRALEQAAEKFSETRQQVVQFLGKAKMFTPQLQAKLLDNDFYARFQVVKFLEGKGMGGAGLGYLKGQIGTLSPIANPVTATLLKDIALVRAANRKLAAKATTDLLGVHFPGEISPSRIGPAGRHLAPAQADQGQIQFLHRGKVESYDVPKYVAEAFRNSPELVGVGTRILSKANVYFRGVFVNRNPGWWLFNVPRDAMRTWKNLPAGFWKSSGLVFDYLNTAAQAAKTAFGVPPEEVQDLFRQKALISDQETERGLTDETSELRRLLRRFQLEKGNPKGPVHRLLLKGWDAWGAVGDMTERWGKLAGNRWLERNQPKMPAGERGHVVRTQIASPDFKRRGAAHATWNNVALFGNAWKEGDRGDWEALKGSPASVTFKTAFLMVPKLLMWAAALGLMGGTFKDVMDLASDYDKTNYVVVPLWTTGEGSKKKGVYLRLPQDFMAQRLGGLLWMGLQTISWAMGKAPAPTQPSKLLDYGAGQAPNLTPAIGIVTDTLGPYLTGRNPYDPYRGKQVVPDVNFKAGGWESHKYVAAQVANQAGAGILKKVEVDKIERPKEGLEKFLDIPIISNTLGRFLKVSDQGIAQQAQQIEADPEKRRAQGQVRVTNDLRNLVNQYKGQVPRSELVDLRLKAAEAGDLDNKNITVADLAARVRRMGSRAGDDRRLEALHLAPSTDAKAALLVQYQRDLPSEQFQDLWVQGRVEKAITPDVVRKMRKQEAGAAKLPW